MKYIRCDLKPISGTRRIPTVRGATLSLPEMRAIFIISLSIYPLKLHYSERAALK